MTTEWYMVQKGAALAVDFVVLLVGLLPRRAHSRRQDRAGRASESILVYLAPAQVEAMWMDELIDAFGACQLLYEINATGPIDVVTEQVIVQLHTTGMVVKGRRIWYPTAHLLSWIDRCPTSGASPAQPPARPGGT